MIDEFLKSQPEYKVRFCIKYPGSVLGEPLGSRTHYPIEVVSLEHRFFMILAIDTKHGTIYQLENAVKTSPPLLPKVINDIGIPTRKVVDMKKIGHCHDPEYFDNFRKHLERFMDLSDSKSYKTVLKRVDEDG